MKAVVTRIDNQQGNNWPEWELERVHLFVLIL